MSYFLLRAAVQFTTTVTVISFAPLGSPRDAHQGVESSLTCRLKRMPNSGYPATRRVKLLPRSLAMVQTPTRQEIEPIAKLWHPLRSRRKRHAARLAI